VNTNLVLPRRQLRLAFAESDLWGQLPQDVQVKCQQQLSRILTAIITDDRSERERDHEREDS
jgi:hypothetical protein